jgi:ATPase subunit of ABC transporter with duplicated ATPase domains
VKGRSPGGDAPAAIWHGQGMPTAAISVDGLTKRFAGRVTVHRLTLDIPRGVVAGFVGPNGAGKTTTMAVLLGLVAPTAGTGADAGTRRLGGGSSSFRCAVLAEAHTVSRLSDSARPPKSLSSDLRLIGWFDEQVGPL